MPSLISASERQVLTGIFNDIFDTFKRDIVVFKAPLKVEAATTGEFLFGYGDAQREDGVTYIERSGVFPAIVRYKPEQTYPENPMINANFADGDVKIKVKGDCKDYIEDGETTKILVDGRTFYLNSEQRKSVFLDSEFFVFFLKATK